MVVNSFQPHTEHGTQPNSLLTASTLHQGSQSPENARVDITPHGRPPPHGDHTSQIAPRAPLHLECQCCLDAFLLSISQFIQFFIFYIRSVLRGAAVVTVLLT